ncbi:MAG: division/cell wall cluster transcriptional repressor MraZ [Caldimicrobium sp.]
MFRGKFKHNLDEKGRLSLPSKFREVLRVRYGTETLIITNMPECLVVYPVSEWKKLEERLLNLPFGMREAREFLRYFLGSAEECEPDKQGRILIPQTLREEIQVEREVVLLGMLTYFEIWNPKALFERFEKIKSNFDDILQVLNPYFEGGRPVSS